MGRNHSAEAMSEDALQEVTDLQPWQVARLSYSVVLSTPDSR